MYPSHRWRAGLLAGATLLVLGGCSSVHIDAEGRRHIVGCGWLTLPPAAEQIGAETLRVRSVGLGLMSGPLGQSAVLGYSDQSLTAIRNDSAVQLSGRAGGGQP